MMQMQKKKIDGIEGEINKIKAEADNFINSYKSEYAKEIDSRMAKLKEDAAQKIEVEKKEQTAKLNNVLIDEALNKVKTSLQKNPELSNQATAKMLDGLK